MMVCSSYGHNLDQIFLSDLGEKSLVQRIPINGSLELTSKCNFSCVHCYNGNATSKEELSTDEWKKVIDQVADAGLLFLLLTGGEPLLRHDFAELYLYAIKKGLKITLFTNGSLFDDSTIELLQHYPPMGIEITLYGASEKAYQQVTGKEKVFARCLENLGKLVECALPVQLKTVFLKENYDEFEGIERIAQKFGVKHRSDGAVFPRLDGDVEPLKHRLNPEQVVQLYLTSAELVAEWKHLAENRQEIAMPENMYSCGAASNCFHVSAEGWLQPCIMVNHIKSSLKKGSFKEGWDNVLPALWNKKMADDHKCRKCTKHYFCDYCPAIFRLETGSENEVSDFLCEVGGLMAQKLQK